MNKEIFDFSEALRRMKEGKKVRRVIWEECGAYIHIVSKTIMAVCDGKFFPCVFKDSEDILATDWEEVLKKKVLTLTVSKQWFDKIVSGEKTEEYREIKSHWIQRLTTGYFEAAIDATEDILYVKVSYRPFIHVLFINGYHKDSPRIEKEIEGVTIGKPQKGMCPDEWLGKCVFIIKFK